MKRHTIVLCILLILGMACKNVNEKKIEDYPSKVLSYYDANIEKPEMIFYFTANTDNESDGVLKMLRENGTTLSISEVKDGLKQGVVEIFYKTGELNVRMEYEKGIMNGTYKSYYKTGVLSIQGEYINGKEDGTWIHYKKNGEESYRKEYIEGKIVE